LDTLGGVRSGDSGSVVDPVDARDLLEDVTVGMGTVKNVETRGCGVRNERRRRSTELLGVLRTGGVATAESEG
jgi:hypothetical protein